MKCSQSYFEGPLLVESAALENLNSSIPLGQICVTPTVIYQRLLALLEKTGNISD